MPGLTMTQWPHRSSSIRSLRVLGSAALLLGAVSCGLTESVPPVATPALGLNRTSVPLGGPLEMTYRFTPAVDGLGSSDDYRVFVHFLADDGELMFADDHAPPEPTSAWRVGEAVTYNRRMIVPVYPYIGDVTVAIGLYSPTLGDRLPLAGEHIGQREYEVARLRMAPQSESGFLMFEDGWHLEESMAQDPNHSWQWTTGQATISFRNPEADSTLYLEVDGRPEVFDTPQILTVLVDETVIATLELASGEPTFHRIEVPVDSFGDTEMVAMTLNVDQTFIPSVMTGGDNPDERELGIQVFYAFLEPN